MRGRCLQSDRPFYISSSQKSVDRGFETTYKLEGSKVRNVRSGITLYGFGIYCLVLLRQCVCESWIDASTSEVGPLDEKGITPWALLLGSPFQCLTKLSSFPLLPLLFWVVVMSHCNEVWCLLYYSLRERESHQPDRKFHLEPQNQEIDELCVAQERLSTNFEALNLWSVRSGNTISCLAVVARQTLQTTKSQSCTDCPTRWRKPGDNVKKKKSYPGFFQTKECLNSRNDVRTPSFLVIINGLCQDGYVSFRAAT